MTEIFDQIGVLRRYWVFLAHVFSFHGAPFELHDDVLSISDHVEIVLREEATVVRDQF